MGQRMEKDICERLEERAVSYEQSGPSAHHTAALLREAKTEIELWRNRWIAADQELTAALQPYTERDEFDWLRQRPESPERQKARAAISASLKAGAPGLSEQTISAIERSIMLKLTGR